MTAGLPTGVRRVLVVCPTWIGDTVMATGPLRRLRAARPDAQLVGLVRPGFDALLDGSAIFDELVVATNRGAFGPVVLGRRLRALGPDAALLLPNSFRWALTARLGRIPRRVGFARDGRGPLLTHPVAMPAERPLAAVAQYARVIGAALGEEVAVAPPRLAVTGAQSAAAERLMHDAPPPRAVLNPGANRPAKRWPADRFAALAAGLAARGMSVAVTGGPAERDLVAEVVRRARDAGATAVDLVERGIDLGALKGVLDRAAVLVTNDTGPRHVAVALGTPTVTLYGPTDHRWTTLPGTPEHPLLAEPFLPETLVADDRPRLCTIERISVGDVLAGVERLLAAVRA